MQISGLTPKLAITFWELVETDGIYRRFRRKPDNVGPDNFGLLNAGEAVLRKGFADWRLRVRLSDETHSYHFLKKSQGDLSFHLLRESLHSGTTRTSSLSFDTPTRQTAQSLCTLFLEDHAERIAALLNREKDELDEVLDLEQD